LRYVEYPTISAGSGLLNIASLHVPGLILASVFGLKVAAWFALGQRILTLPLTIIGNAVGQVYNGHAAVLAREDPSALKKLFVKTSRELFITGCLTIVPAACLAPFAIEVALGPEWSHAADYVVVLAPALIAQFVVSPVSGTLAIQRRLGCQAALDALRLLLIGGSLIACGTLGYPALTCIAVLSAMSVICHILYFGTYLRSFE
jgi:O-antigen/teichoic acid export membrane protein